MEQDGREPRENGGGLKTFASEDNQRKQKRKNPEEAAWLLSIFTFAWMSPLIREGNQKVLEADDLYDLASYDQSRHIATRFQAALDQEKKKTKSGPLSLPSSPRLSSWSLFLSLARVFSRPFLLAGCIKLVYDCLQFLNPVVLHAIISAMEKNGTPENSLLHGPLSALGSGWGFLRKTGSDFIGPESGVFSGVRALEKWGIRFLGMYGLTQAAEIPRQHFRASCGMDEEIFGQFNGSTDSVSSLTSSWLTSASALHPLWLGESSHLSLPLSSHSSPFFPPFANCSSSVPHSPSPSSSPHFSSPLPMDQLLPSSPLALSLLLFFSSLVQSVLIHQYFHMLFRLAGHIRAALVSSLYDKSLRLSVGARQSTSIGQIVNYQSNDAEKIAKLVLYAHIIWSGPFQIICALVLLCYVIGPLPTLSGLCVMLFLFPFNTIMTRRIGQVRKSILAATDRRVKITSEVFSGVKAIKLYAWEDPFEQKMQQLRGEEMREIKKSNLLRALNSFVYFATPVFVSLVSLTTYVLMYRSLSPSVAFPSVALFNLLRFPLTMVPDQINDVIQANVSLGRLSEFFSLGEKGRDPSSLDKQEDSSADSIGESLPLSLSLPPPGGILLRNASFAWEEREGNKKDPGGKKEGGRGESSREARKASPPAGELSQPLLTSSAVAGQSPADVALSGSNSSSGFRLSNLSLLISPGELVIVVGKVGSGKSSLLLALLGEMPLVDTVKGDKGRVGESEKGEVLVNTSEGHSIAYTAQDPWIQHCSLRENVILRNEREETERERERYETVIRACALDKDLETLPNGDLTEIGEKGINLSGGQKHRVALARACFSPAKTFLLDDPLSAVDSHVGRHLFDHCIVGLLGKFTRVLVTHQTQYLPFADKVVVVEDGTIRAVGTYEELRRSGVPFDLFQNNEASEGGKERDSESKTSLPLVSLPSSSPSTPALQSKGTREEITAQGKGGKEKEPRKDNLVKEETRSKGKVKASVYADYLRAWGENSGRTGEREGVPDSTPEALPSSPSFSLHRSLPFFSASLVLTLFLLTQGLKVASDTWLAIWTETQVKEGGGENGGVIKLPGSGGDWWGASSFLSLSPPFLSFVSAPGAHLFFYLQVYALLSLLTALLSYLRVVELTKASVRASSTIHSLLLSHSLALPLSFFDSQPVGRILNRFTRDMEAVDITLPNTIISFLSCMCQVLFALGIIVYVTPLFSVPLIPVVFIYAFVQRYYINASRELKRIDSISRSPIFAHFGETLNGLVTIRAFGREEDFKSRNFDKIDCSTRAYIASAAANRWLGYRLEILGACTVLCTSVLCVSKGLTHLGAGFVGLALTNALTITGFMNWMVRMNSEIETQMNSVERLFEYADIPSEAPSEIPETKPPPDWPQRGVIEVTEIVVRYRQDLNPVLQDVSFSVRPSEKVGVCGRTGCGKSTLVLCLFRVMELEKGRIEIDGIDVSTIGLRDLRSRMALVPQDPVIFSGPVRFNLDPFGEASKDGNDLALWEALDRVGLGTFVRELPGQLDSELVEGGLNLSTGQRQLLCMARALLRNSRILVLDEATSNVDPVTDGLIQTTIRTCFRSCTVLTIAHRLHTILDSDRVLLLDEGKVVEFDKPSVLANDEGSRFAGFLQKTAVTM